MFSIKAQVVYLGSPSNERLVNQSVFLLFLCSHSFLKINSPVPFFQAR